VRRVAVGVAIALVSVGLSPSPADANAKHLAEQIGCAALGIWRGEVEVGESASAVPAEAVALAWRTFKPVKDRLPRAAWRSFDKDRAFKALVDWCQAHYPDMYQSGYDAGTGDRVPTPL
jgi:hypothetical protein